MENHPLVTYFTAMVDGWNAAGWGEYLAWETLEGIRDRPFKFFDKLPAEAMEAMRRLRDELKIWPYWDGVTKAWHVVDVNTWREHTVETTADTIFNLLHNARYMRAG